jgi:hypothetical protein
MLPLQNVHSDDDFQILQTLIMVIQFNNICTALSYIMFDAWKSGEYYGLCNYNSFALHGL